MIFKDIKKNMRLTFDPCWHIAAFLNKKEKRIKIKFKPKDNACITVYLCKQALGQNFCHLNPPPQKKN